MDTIAEIDKAGRVVVPKKLRDALHLVPGTRLLLQQQGESIVLRPEPRGCGLYKEKGTWVYDAGPLPPFDSRKWLEEDRNSRISGSFRAPFPNDLS